MVLPFRPVEGWRQADRGRRVGAVLCAVGLAVWVVSLGWTWEQLDRLPGYRVAHEGSALLLLAFGPFVCHAAARVLRPHPPGTRGERVHRHWWAAVAATTGVGLLPWTLGVDHGWTPAFTSSVYYYVFVAPVAGATSLAWGLVAALVRVSRTGVPAPSTGF